MRMTQGKGLVCFRRNAIGIATAALVMVGFRIFAPAIRDAKVSSSIEGTVSQ